MALFLSSMCPLCISLAIVFRSVACCHESESCEQQHEQSEYMAARLELLQAQIQLHRNLETSVKLRGDQVEEHGADVLHSGANQILPLGPFTTVTNLNASVVNLNSEGSNASSNSSLNLTQDATCIENTGGTCALLQCSTWRGPTTCSVGRCFCQPGWCASGDGTCYQEKNKLIGTIRLRNARWPGQYMYVSNFVSDLYVSSSVNDQDDFNLYSLPGPGNDYLLSSVRWPMYVVSIYWKQECSSTGDSQRCSSKLVAGTTRIEYLSSAPVDQLALRFLTPPAFEGAPNKTQFVMIESWSQPNRFLYIGRFSWQVGVSSYDPGVGGYWAVESEDPLHLELPTYQGPRCNYDCGAYGSKSDWTGGPVSTTGQALIILGSILAACCCFSAFFVAFAKH